MYMKLAPLSIVAKQIIFVIYYCLHDFCFLFTCRFGQSSMDIVVRRCPFVSRVPQSFLQQARKSLVVYAQRCPVMMDLASRPLARSISSSASSFQKTENTTTNEGELSSFLWVSFIRHPRHNVKSFKRHMLVVIVKGLMPHQL